ncbi:DNA double-strand break repair nuclease NurA [Halorussus halophilus]|uniref:DNA double-strand break repair nuclease NurA n=1 Tax=Halorussus halophilus TaxID=2650975 RepID=UPI0013019054|nr:DNA double-strand break repair nuclease NurA [Halorussus halophilus]
MTLDPVHFDGIAGLADHIDYDAEDRDHRELAEEAWERLDPLWNADNETVLEPIDELGRRCVGVEDIALVEDEFSVTHGLDSGTLNPKVFKNGLVLDVAHAAMSASPSDLSLHDCRTVVKAVHSNDNSEKFQTPWEPYNEGSERRIVHTDLPRSQYEEDAVHALALYLAESHHALENADRVSDFLLLDGPIYPKGVLRWNYRSSALADLFEESPHVNRILENYVELVERFHEREVPMAGFVKNVSTKSVVRTLKQKGDFGPVPWAHDAALFSQVLERREDDGNGGYDRLTDKLTLTNWFVSRAGADTFFVDEGEDYVDLELETEQYRVTFCFVYDPRRDLIFKIEAPYAVTDDEETRRKIERQLCKEVAARRGPPLSISKADSLAAIDRGSGDSLIKAFEDSLDTELDENYDTVRWGRGY